MKKLLKNCRGGSSIIFIGLLFFMLMLTMLVMEMGAVQKNYTTALSVLQRSANSAVEKNMDDAYRADGILKLNAGGAKADFEMFAANDLGSKYTLSISSLSALEEPPSLEATGTITFPTLFSKYGFEDVSFTFRVKAENFEVGHD